MEINNKELSKHGNHRIERRNFRGYGLLTDLYCLDCKKYIWREE